MKTSLLPPCGGIILSDGDVIPARLEYISDPATGYFAERISDNKIRTNMIGMVAAFAMLGTTLGDGELGMTVDCGDGTYTHTIILPELPAPKNATSEHMPDYHSLV